MPPASRPHDMHEIQAQKQVRLSLNVLGIMAVVVPASFLEGFGLGGLCRSRRKKKMMIIITSSCSSLQPLFLTLDGWQRFFDRKWVSILLVDAWAIPEFPPGSEIGQWKLLLAYRHHGKKICCWQRCPRCRRCKRRICPPGPSRCPCCARGPSSWPGWWPWGTLWLRSQLCLNKFGASLSAKTWKVVEQKKWDGLSIR